MSTPQTLCTMEAAMKLSPGPEADFWAAQERIGPIVAAAPGFVGVIGGEITDSTWMYFSGKFETPDHMDQWYHDEQHKPVMAAAHSLWFDAVYIRKWRAPMAGEALEGPLWVETSIAPAEPLASEVVAATMSALRSALPKYGVAPYETLIGQFEPQPFQFAGPLQEFPALAPVRYLLLTHWDSADAWQSWLDSADYKALSELGEVSSQPHLLLKHAPGERQDLNADGSQRGWYKPKPRPA
jgi:heme-degrading monooxygenase HmoA